MSFIFRILLPLNLTFFSFFISYAGSPSSSLFEELKSRYISSSTAYPLESIQIQDPYEPSFFKGCSIASSQSVATVEGGIAVRFDRTIKSGNGPLDPAEYESYTLFVRPRAIPFYMSHGAVFKNGVFNLDAVEFYSREGTGCTDKTKEGELIQSSGFSLDGKSYRYTSTCQNGELSTQQDYRVSGNYLVGRTLRNHPRKMSNGEVEAREEYFYCW